MLIKKLDITSDSDLVLNDLNSLLPSMPTDVWNSKNQMGLRYRNNATNIWEDSVGSLFDYNLKTHVGFERDFTNWCINTDYYVRQEIEKLENVLGIKTGRVRFMRLQPRKGLTIHRDSEERYHLVLKTNSNALFGFAQSPTMNESSDLPAVGISYHIPKDNHWYKANTTEFHWVFNGGFEERIHLVVSEI